MTPPSQPSLPPKSNEAPRPITRRAFIRDGTLFMTTALAGPNAARFLTAPLLAADPNAKPALRIGLLTDVHYADKPPAGSRHYRDSLDKMRTAVNAFNHARAQLAFHLGDFIDSADDLQTEIGYLKAIDAEYARFKGPRHYVLGNHCVFSLTKQEFIDNSAATAAHYSFDHAGFHLVVLDACYRADGVPYGRKNFDWTDTEIPAPQRDWLQADLAATHLPTLAFVHQRLDVAGNYGIHSAPQVRQILEASGKVLAVFQGHNHINDHNEINKIHYCTLAAMVEGPGPDSTAYALLDLFPDRSLRLTGFANQANHNLPAART